MQLTFFLLESPWLPLISCPGLLLIIGHVRSLPGPFLTDFCSGLLSVASCQPGEGFLPACPLSVAPPCFRCYSPSFMKTPCLLAGPFLLTSFHFNYYRVPSPQGPPLLGIFGMALFSHLPCRGSAVLHLLILHPHTLRPWSSAGRFRLAPGEAPGLFLLLVACYEIGSPVLSPLVSGLGACGGAFLPRGLDGPGGTASKGTQFHSLGCLMTSYWGHVAAPGLPAWAPRPRP